MSHDKHSHPKPHEKPEPVEPGVSTFGEEEPTLPTPGSGDNGPPPPPPGK